SIYRWAWASHEYVSWLLIIPFPEYSSHFVGSEMMALREWDIAEGESTSTRSPFFAFSTISLGPPVGEATTGSPEAAASMRVSPKFSPGVAFTKAPFLRAATR